MTEDAGIGDFLAEAEEILEAVGQDLVRLEASSAEGEPDPEVINSIFRGAHSLKGIAAMSGFTPITEVSHKTETLLDALRMGRVGCERPVLDLLFESADVLRSLCDRVAAGQDGDLPSVEAFVGRLLAAAEGSPGGSGTRVESLGLPREALDVLTDYELHRLEETLKSPKRQLFRVRADFPLETFDTDLEALNERLKGCGEIISTLPAPGSSDADRLEFDLLVGAKVDLDAVREAAGSEGIAVDVLGGPAVSPPTVSAREPRAPAPGVDAAAATSSPPAPRAAPERAGSNGEGELRSLTQTVRVDLPKLDTLMNLVGELVITKGRIQMVGDRLRDRLGFTAEVMDLSKAQKELDRKLSELQAAVMDARMVPMGQLFAKLHRVLRKVLHGSEKEVELEIVGAETELDKLIVEDLSDPLIHVLRNAVDHGIESPEVRVERGKPRRGKVRIEARQRGSHVLIAVSDDGAGLSPERIRRKAVERGLIAEGDRLEEKELFDLVFLPGFSTRDEVTEISGRGVGMDVLRKNIAALAGMIELNSEEGAGTTVTIILPITLAIIQALMVRVVDQTYAIPLNSVLETLALEADMARRLEGHPVLRLRDATMPLVRVDRLLGGGDGPPPPAYAVVVGIAEKRVALGVDDLVSQQDIVIKSLGRRLSGLKGLAGATDLGDQKTIPVLDVASLVDEVFVN